MTGHNKKCLNVAMPDVIYPERASLLVTATPPWTKVWDVGLESSRPGVGVWLLYVLCDLRKITCLSKLQLPHLPNEINESPSSRGSPHAFTELGIL